MVRPADLAISDELRRDLQAWNDGYTETSGASPELYQRPVDRGEGVWRRKGEELAQRLRDELGPSVEVAVKLWE